MFLARLLLNTVSGHGKRARLAVLTYHRVFERADPLIPWDIDKTQFSSHVRFLKSACIPMTVSKAVSLLFQGELPRRAICITFDDGYSDNHDVALPVLQAFDVPATFYVATGFLNGGIMWNDRVIMAVRKLGTGQHTTPSLPTFNLRNDAGRADLAYELIMKIRYRPHEERDHISRELAAYASVPRSEIDSLMMTDNMVRNLADQGMEVGAHTVSHPILSQLEEDKAELEIRQSKGYLENILQSKIRSFAFPNGRFEIDLTERDIRLVTEAGFENAVSTDWGAASANSSPMALPRLGLHGNSQPKYLLQLLKSYRSKDIHEAAKTRLMRSG